MAPENKRAKAAKTIETTPEMRKHREDHGSDGRFVAGNSRRPPDRLGVRNPLPQGAINALKTAKFRIKKDYSGNEPACEIAGFALESMVRVMMGKVWSKKAPSMLKAAVALREEICEPVVKESKISGTLGIAGAVAAANARIITVPGRVLPPSAPAGADLAQDALPEPE